MTKKSFPRFIIWLIPAILSIIALAKLPYGYYQFLRIVICIAASYLIYREYNLNNVLNIWSAVFALLAILFNPIIPIHLPREVWGFFNVACAIAFIMHLIVCIKKNQFNE
ncbi:MAG TPA: DUF6804 family protein [Gammaproteobacteria bacterium]|nr:DUF6804 family protein [Gammaproteobacteria bacterium]